MVGVSRLELLTSRSQSARATNCAKPRIVILHVFGGRSGNRTHTPLLELDFESGASTNSAIRPS